MSRGIITTVDYGRHRVSAFHPRVDQLEWPIDALGAIMDFCKGATKICLGRTNRRMYKLLQDRIHRANIHIIWPRVGGRNIKSTDSVDKYRETIHINEYKPRIMLDNYAELIPPKCERCQKYIHDDLHQYDPEYYWCNVRTKYAFVYVSDCAHLIRTFLCDKCLILLTPSVYDIAAARMRVAQDLELYEDFFINMARFYVTSNRDYTTKARIILSKKMYFALQPKYIRKDQVSEWQRIVRSDLSRNLSDCSFPFHALQLFMADKIFQMTTLRDIKMMKCVSKLLNITFTGVEIAVTGNIR